MRIIYKGSDISYIDQDMRDALYETKRCPECRGMNVKYKQFLTLTSGYYICQCNDCGTTWETSSWIRDPFDERNNL